MHLKKSFTLELWMSIQLIILLVTTFYIFASNHENVEALFVGIESFLIFPAGIVTFYLNEIFSVHSYLLSHESFFLFVLINWVFYTIIGYYQWFVLFPKILNKCKSEGCLSGYM